MIKKIKLLIAVVLLGGLLSSGDVLALDPSNMNTIMTISPPIEKIILTPGEVYEGSVRVSNATGAKKDLKYSVRIGSFGLREDENGNTDYNNTDVDTVTSYNQIMNWITLGKESGTVAPGETDTLPYTIRVPEDAPAGGQYASIIFRNDTGRDETGGNVMIEDVVEFAESILTEVAGETRDEGQILENNIPVFVFNGKLSTTSMVRNDGNVHTDASYVLQVWPLFSDEEICTNEENPTTSLIMPESERLHVEKPCSDPNKTDEFNLPIGIYRVKQTVKIFGETSIAEKTVISCPLWLLFLIIFVIALIVIWIIARIKASNKREARD